jgi:dishevelled associated activator of morphogenesis
VKFFGEDYTQIDEFFSIFDQFLNSFLEAKAENESLRKRREEEGKKVTTVS